MKYAIDLEYKGLELNIDLPKMSEPELRGHVRIPGDINIHIQGEYSWLEVLICNITMNKMIKKLLK